MHTGSATARQLTSVIERNRAYLTEFFSGSPGGHAAILLPEWNPNPLGDFAVSNRPVSDWVPWAVRGYEMRLEKTLSIEDDDVPYVHLATNTAMFAAAFGAEVHQYDSKEAPVARPFVEGADEAAKIPQPEWTDSPLLVRHMELARLVAQELGPEVPISVPDMQSPLDIVAMIWDKSELFPALVEEPEIVQALIEKCHALLTSFWDDMLKAIPNVSMGHWPMVWGPPSQGVWITEDEVGSLSPGMFRKFVLPSLTSISERYGGLTVHSCANAVHQHQNFLEIPRLRAMNRTPRDQVAPMRDFAGKVPLLVPNQTYEQAFALIEQAPPEMRWMFIMDPLQDKAREQRMFDRLRGALGR
jgi:hypothetical protein